MCRVLRAALAIVEDALNAPTAGVLKPTILHKVVGMAIHRISPS